MLNTIKSQENSNFDRLAFYKKFFLLAFPITLQQLINVSLNFIDNLMVGKLGTSAIAAVGFGNQIFFIYILFLVGLFSAATTYMQQYFGKKDYIAMQKIFFFFTLLLFTISVVLTIIILFFSKQIMLIFSTDEAVLKQGQDYLDYICLFFPFFAISFALASSFRTIGITYFSLIVSAIVAIINTVLNYLLIYGNFGFPELGVKGAAIATFIARIVEFLCFVFIFLKSDYAFKTSLKKYFPMPLNIIKEVIKSGIPMFLQEVVWVLGTTIVLIAYSKAGTDAVAVLNIANIVTDMGIILFMGVSISASISIGHQIGAGSIEKAKLISREVLKIAIVLAILSTIAGFLIIKPILSMFTLPEYIISTTHIILSVVAISLFFKMMNWTIIIGILRSGGDAMFPLLLDTIPLFLYAIPIAFISILVWDIPLYWVVALVAIEEIIKLTIGLYRYFSNKWINNLTQRGQNKI
jgi:putative MATE family efflux protein